MICFFVCFCIICLVLYFCFIDYKGCYSDKMMLIVMFPLMAFVSSNLDTAGYNIFYDSIQADDISTIGVTDPGFGLIMYFGKLIGYDYRSFLIMYTVIGMLFLIIVIRKLSVCPSVFLAIYFVFFFPTFTIQIRSFVAETIIYIMIVSIVNDAKFNLKKFILLMTFAVLFHATSLFFVLLLLPTFIKRRNILLIFVSLSFLIVPVTATILRHIPIPMIQYKVGVYLNQSRSHLSVGALVLVIGFIFVLGILYLFYKKENKQIWKDRLDILFRINLIGLIACGLVLFFDSNFYRLIRMLIASDLLVLGNCLFMTHNIDAQKRAILSGILICVFICKEIILHTVYNLSANNTVLSLLMDVV